MFAGKLGGGGEYFFFGSEIPTKRFFDIFSSFFEVLRTLGPGNPFSDFFRSFLGRGLSSTPVEGQRCPKVLPFLTFQCQRCIKFRVFRAQDFYTPLALNCQKGQPGNTSQQSPTLGVLKRFGVPGVLGRKADYKGKVWLRQISYGDSISYTSLLQDCLSLGLLLPHLPWRNSTAPFAGHEAISEGRGGVVYFEPPPPCGRNLFPPPPLSYTLHPYPEPPKGVGKEGVGNSSTDLLSVQD